MNLLGSTTAPETETQYPIQLRDAGLRRHFAIPGPDKDVSVFISYFLDRQVQERREFEDDPWTILKR